MTSTFFDFLIVETFIVRYSGEDAICIVLSAQDWEGELSDASALEEMPEIRIVVSIETGKVLVITSDSPVVEPIH
jgi:hypothetical protein